jgi:hypothetical protein
LGSSFLVPSGLLGFEVYCLNSLMLLSFPKLFMKVLILFQ